MCGGCNTSSATTAANPDAQAAYTDVVGKAQAVAGTPYQPYGGELVAGLNDGQNTAISRLGATYGAAQPYIRQGSADMAQAGAGLGNVQQYLQAGSTATANVQPYMDMASNEFGQSNSLVSNSLSALGGVGQYLDAAKGAYGQEQAGLGQVGSYLGKADGYFGQAAGLAAPQDFSGADGVSKYMDPYQQSVIDATMAWAKQNNAAQTSSLVGNAIGNGAYGGDRNGIAVATLAGQQDMADQSTVAGLNAANYAQATQQFNAVQGQRQQGAQILSGLGSGELSAAGTQLNTALGYGQAGAGYAGLGTLQGQTAGQYGSLASISNSIGSGYNATGQLGLGTAAQYGSLGNLQGTTGQAYGTLGGQVGALGAANQSSLISGASAGLQGATLGQQNAQQQDTALYNQYMAGLSYPYQNVGFLSNIVQGIGSQEGNTQTTQGNALSSIAGLGTSTIGILGATGAFGANGYLSGLGSAASGALSFSDERVKENIAPVGKTFDGQTLHRYNYKGEDPARPQIGLIAQEVAQRDPGAVGDMGGGILGVNYDRATAASAKMGLGNVGDFAAVKGADLAARMAKATGGPVLGFGLAGRPAFDDGGTAVPGAPIPSAGLNVSPAALLSAGGLNTGAGLGSGRPIQAAAAPASGGGQGIGALTAAPSAMSGPGAGLGAPISFSGPGTPGTGGVTFSGDGKSDGTSPTGGSGGGFGNLSQNAWMGVLAAGLGMMGGHSASAANNIGAGGLAGLQTYLGLEQQDKSNAVQQQKLSLEKQGLDQTDSFQQATLGLDQKKVDLSTKQLEAEIANQQRQAGIQSAQLANDTARTQGQLGVQKAQIAASTAETASHLQTVTPAGILQRDPANPLGTPKLTPWSAIQGPPPDPAAATPAQPAAAAPPPPGGVSASGAAPAQGAGLPAPAPAGGAPAALDVPKNLPINPMMMSPMGQDIIKKQTSEALTAANSAATGAQNTKMSLAQMQHDLAQLPASGFLAAGPGQQQRAAIAGQVNATLRGLGVSDQNLINPNAVASSEELKKLTNRMGFDLAKSLGGREPGFIVQQAVGSVPSSENSPMGAQRLVAGMSAVAQRQIDYRDFAQKWAASTGGDVTGMDDYFNKARPPQMYANQAILSTLPPAYVDRLRQVAAQDPTQAANFDRRFGTGTAALVLGQQ